MVAAPLLSIIDEVYLLFTPVSFLVLPHTHVVAAAIGTNSSKSIGIASDLIFLVAHERT
jgi:hypothetical protein